MANEENRVLGRMGARVITTEETKSIKAAGSATTQLCTIISVGGTGTVTGSGDGDGCSDTDNGHFA